MHFQTINYILYPGKFQRVISGSEDHFLPAMIVWMGHTDATMIMKVYAKLTAEKEQLDASKLNDFTKARFLRLPTPLQVVVSNPRGSVTK